VGQPVGVQIPPLALAYPITSYVNDALIHQVVRDDDWGQIGGSVAFALDSAIPGERKGHLPRGENRSQHY